MKPISHSNLASQNFLGSFSIGDRKIIPVLSSTYHTVDFQKNPNAILYSDGVTACAVLVIKSFNEKTEKYDNVVTMAHFFPNNGYDVRTAQGNIYKAMEDFINSGGKLNSKKTSFQLFGGHDFPGRPFSDSIKAIMIDAINEMGIPSKHKFTNHESSIITDPLESIAVFVDSAGTQITKRNLRTQEISNLAPIKDSLPLDLLSSIVFSAPKNYERFADKLASEVGDASMRVDRMGLNSMSEVVKHNLHSSSEEISRR